MPNIEVITPLNAVTYKTVRLHALKDSPSSFCSTYARESQFTDADWLKRAANLDRRGAIGLLAMDRAIPCGIVGCFVDEQNPHCANIVSMWVAPTHRKTGLGSKLIEAIRTWAADQGVRELELMVTNCNHTAIQFYERLGFLHTGVTAPYPNDEALFEYQMMLRL